MVYLGIGGGSYHKFIYLYVSPSKEYWTTLIYMFPLVVSKRKSPLLDTFSTFWGLKQMEPPGARGNQGGGLRRGGVVACVCVFLSSYFFWSSSFCFCCFVFFVFFVWFFGGLGVDLIFTVVGMSLARFSFLVLRWRGGLKFLHCGHVFGLRGFVLWFCSCERVGCETRSLLKAQSKSCKGLTGPNSPTHVLR